jgi:dolichyl-phosphate beta-glucosyltransferase
MLSIVLPCYRAAPTARRSIEALRKVLPSIGEPWEIIAVDDGGCDFHPQEYSDDPRVRLVRFPRNRGKGAALRAGLVESRGDVRILTDIDLPYGIELFPVITRLIRQRGFHVVLGDRTLPGSSYPEEKSSVGRRLLSSVASEFIGRVVTGGFHDTQCGLKAIRGDVADLLVPLTIVNRFAFDVEFVYLCLYHRLDIKRLPVTLHCNGPSTVRPIRDALTAAADIFGIKVRQMRRQYESVALQALLGREMLRLVGD